MTVKILLLWGEFTVVANSFQRIKGELLKFFANCCGFQKETFPFSNKAACVRRVIFSNGLVLKVLEGEGRFIVPVFIITRCLLSWRRKIYCPYVHYYWVPVVI